MGSLSLEGMEATARHPCRASLHSLPVHFRIAFEILLFAFKWRNGLAPSYLSNLLEPYVPSRFLKSSDQLLLVVPASRMKLRLPVAVAAPKLRNKLPLHVRPGATAGLQPHLKVHSSSSLAFQTPHQWLVPYRHLGFYIVCCVLCGTWVQLCCLVNVLYEQHGAIKLNPLNQSDCSGWYWVNKSLMTTVWWFCSSLFC